MTYVAYFVLLVSLAFVVFMFHNADNKEKKDFILMACLLVAALVGGCILALDELHVI